VADTVSVVEHVGLQVAGENFADAPLGNPVTENVAVSGLPPPCLVSWMLAAT